MVDSQTEKLLVLSVEQYHNILRHAEKLLKMFDICDYSQMDDQVLMLQQLQAAATQQDNQLIPLLEADFIAWKDDARYQLRNDYINSILKLNELLVPKIRGVMAVTSVELKKMRGGRTALAGYASRVVNKRDYRSIG